MTEVQAWETFYDVLRLPVPEEEYAALCARLRPRAVALMDLLDVEMEMLTNPPARYYEHWLRTYRGVVAMSDYQAGRQAATLEVLIASLGFKRGCDLRADAAYLPHYRILP